MVYDYIDYNKAFKNFRQQKQALNRKQVTSSAVTR